MRIGEFFWFIFLIKQEIFWQDEGGPETGRMKPREEKMTMLSRVKELFKGRASTDDGMTDDNSPEKVRARRDQVKFLQTELQNLGLSWDILVKQSPRDWQVLEGLKEAAFSLSHEVEGVSSSLLQNPSQLESWLAARVALAPSILGKHGCYLVALALIIKHDLTYLLPFIMPAKRRYSYGGN